MLYACDAAWWRTYSGVPAFKGLKLTQDKNVPRQFPDVQRVEVLNRVNDLVFSPLGVIGNAKNSGFQALNCAIHMGAREIGLVGYDCTLMKGVHWHGRHVPGLNNPSQAGVDKWREHLDRQAPALKHVGIKITVASTFSALEAYEKCTFEELVARWN